VIAIAGFLLWKNRSAASGEQIFSVVVLPFSDFSEKHDQEYFSDGLTEEIIDALSRVPNLRVVARTSAFAFKGKANDVREIGRQLDVGAVLEGSVRKDGDRLRVTAQLNRTSDGTHIWSQKYDRELRDVFAVQQEISQAIAARLRAGEVPPQRRGTSDMEAYQAFQEGRFFFNQQEPEAYHKAIERFQKAIDRDPKFVQAYAAIADCWGYLAENFVEPPREVMPKALAAAERAIAIDPNAAEGHISRGMVKLDYEWDREGAQAEFQRALQLNPGSMWAHHWYAHSLETQGKVPEAMKEMQNALSLDPLSLVLYWDIGNEYLMQGRYQDALNLLKKGDELFPNFWLLAWERAESYRGLKDLAAMTREVEKMKAANPEMKDFPPFKMLLASYDVYGGNLASGRRALDEMEQIRKSQYVEPYMGIQLASSVGDHERLKLWMKRLIEERSTLYLYFPQTVGYLQEGPEVREMIARIKNDPPPPLR